MESDSHLVQGKPGESVRVHSIGQQFHESPTGGHKEVKDIRYSLLPWDQLAEVARVYNFGTIKYDVGNWEKGYAWSYSYDSLVRHAAAFWGGEDTDQETQCHHLASVVFHALALMRFGQTHPDLDDRRPHNG